LDQVAGPENWNADYRPWGNGMRCDLTIVLPDGSSVTKWDVGGFSSMQDDGDNEKAGLSDALKRAAVLFGIGRELYGDDSTVPHLARMTADLGIPQAEETGYRRCAIAEHRPAEWSSPVVDLGTYVPPLKAKTVESVSTVPRKPSPPRPQAPLEPPFEPTPSRNPIDDLKANGLLKTGAQVYGTPTSPPPQRDLSRDDVFEKVGDMIGGAAPAKPFLQFIQEKCRSGNEVFLQKCRHQNLPAPKNDPLYPEMLAFLYCDRAIANGGVDQRAVTAGGEYVAEACLEAMENHYNIDPRATERAIDADIDLKVSEEVGNIEREKYKSENGGKAPNRVPDRPQGNPAPPPQRGGNSGDAPKTGKALFARVKEIEQREEVALTKWVSSFCKMNNLPDRMIDLSPDQIAFVYDAVLEKVASVRSDEPHAEALSN
jgi:hypothetical protein